jgi:hypothetical protein
VNSPSAANASISQLHTDTSYALCWWRPFPAFAFGGPLASAPGAGGAFGYGDSDLGLGYGYVTDRMGRLLGLEVAACSDRAAVSGVERLDRVHGAEIRASTTEDCVRPSDAVIAGIQRGKDG